MTPYEIHLADQHSAREREFDRKAQKGAAVFLAAFAVLGVYAFLACAGLVPPAPWSPLG